MKLLASLSVLLLFFRGAHGAQWSSGSPPDGLTMFVCSGDTVTFTWQYLLDAGDVVGDTEWLYDGHSQELVAMMSHGHLLVSPAFSQRVQVVDNAGISLSNVIVGDSGNYSVEVNVYTNSGATHNVLRRTAVLDLSGADSLQTVDGSLHVRQNPEAVFDNATNQWAMQLQCGVFKFISNPPVQVEWTGPSGQTYSSNDYSNGYFNLLIPKPIPVGSFTCRLSARFAACLHGNAGHMDHAVLTVDSLEARMAIVEKENEQCSSTCSSGTGATTGQDVRVDQLQAQLQRTESTLSALNRTMTQEIQQLGAQLQHMTQENQQLKTQLQHTESTLNTVNSTITHESQQLQTQLQHTESTLSALTSTMTQENQQLETQLQRTEGTVNTHTQELATVNHEIATLNTKLTQLQSTNAQTSLTATTSDLSQRLAKLEDTARYRVAFHATGLMSDLPASGTPLIFGTVHYNQGGAYNNATGNFVVPADGVYFCISSTGPYDANTGTWFDLFVDNTWIDDSYSYMATRGNYEMSSVHGVMHLRAGQRVWIRSSSGHYYGPSSSFTGFLLSRDV